MTKNAGRISGATPALGEVSESPDDASERGREPVLTSLLRRARLRVVPPAETGGWCCPDCGLAAEDRVAARLGFCSRCLEFTGMCAAGRKFVFPDVMSMTIWHLPCTNLGTSAWQLSQGPLSREVKLCPQHDADVRAGRASFLTEAVALAPEAPFTIGPPPV
jgi:hypothetical protein